MVYEVTKGIKVSVKTRFKGNSMQDGNLYRVFSYLVKIENHSESAVQLIHRHWQIKDALKNIEYVDGEGVVGKQPIIEQGASYTYSSGCLLVGDFGEIKGYYQLVQCATIKKFKVNIPSFKLFVPFLMN